MKFFLFFFALLFLPLAQAQPAPAPEVQRAYSALITVLENPQSREEFLTLLRAQTSGSGASAKAEPTPNAPEEKVISDLAKDTKTAVISAITLPKRIAQTSIKLAREVGARVRGMSSALSALFAHHGAYFRALDWGALLRALRDIAIVAVLAFGLYGLLRRSLQGMKNRLESWVERSAPTQAMIRRALACSLVALCEALFLGLTYLLLNAVALGISGGGLWALFLSAFGVIELLKIGLRAMFYPEAAALRFLPGQNSVARYWYTWARGLINIVGYGELVGVALVSQFIAQVMGQMLLMLLAFFAFVYGLVMIVRNRAGVRHSIEQLGKRAHGIFGKVLFALLGLIWHWLAGAYFLMLLLVMLLQSEQALPFVLRGSLLSLLIIGVALLCSDVLTQWTERYLHLPLSWRRHLPGLERRLNAYVPLTLRALHIGLIALSVVMLLSAWDVVHLSTLWNAPQVQLWSNRLLGVLMILLSALFLWLISASLIEHRLGIGEYGRRPGARAQTLLSLFQKALAITLGTITAMMALSELGINIGPLLAGASVLGLAVGFGSQKLVQDIITGVFIQIENAMNTGDVVTVDGITGTAERISIRTVSLRDISGTYHIIPFSNVTTVSNYMRGYAYHKAEYGIGYNEDIDEATEQLKAAFEELMNSEHKSKILEPITIAGVTELGDSAVNIRVLIKTTPGDQWAVGRAYNRLVKIYFDRAGIEIPYPHQTLYFGKDKHGKTPPANIRIITERERFAPAPEPEQGQGIQTPNQSLATKQPDEDGSL